MHNVHDCPKVINFTRYNTKCCGEHEILRGIFVYSTLYTVQYLVLLYISYYISEIWISFRTVCISPPGEVCGGCEDEEAGDNVGAEDHQHPDILPGRLVPKYVPFIKKQIYFNLYLIFFLGFSQHSEIF